VDSRFASIGVVGPQPVGGLELGAGSHAATGATAAGFNAMALGPDASALGTDAYAGGANATALGADTHVGADNGTAVGAQAHIDPAAQNATAIGFNASVGPGGTNSVAIGAGSVANDPNTVSFGSPGNERRLENVAPGIDGTDAVNLNQLESATAREDRAVRQAYGGVAMAFALTSVAPTLAPGEQSLVAGVGAFGSQTAFSIKYEARLTNHVFIGTGVAAGTNNGVGGSAGIGFKW
jgi:autotransporter adhesin